MNRSYNGFVGQIYSHKKCNDTTHFAYILSVCTVILYVIIYLCFARLLSVLAMILLCYVYFITLSPYVNYDILASQV